MAGRLQHGERADLVALAQAGRDGDGRAGPPTQLPAGDRVERARSRRSPDSIASASAWPASTGTPSSRASAALAPWWSAWAWVIRWPASCSPASWRMIRRARPAGRGVDHVAVGQVDVEGVARRAAQQVESVGDLSPYRGVRYHASRQGCTVWCAMAQSERRRRAGDERLDREAWIARRPRRARGGRDRGRQRLRAGEAARRHPRQLLLALRQPRRAARSRPGPVGARPLRRRPRRARRRSTTRASGCGCWSTPPPPSRRRCSSRLLEAQTREPARRDGAQPLARPAGRLPRAGLPRGSASRPAAARRRALAVYAAYVGLAQLVSADDTLLAGRERRAFARELAAMVVPDCDAPA